MHPPPWASKINEKPIFSIQNPSKTFCNLPRALWKRHRAFWSRSNVLWRTLRRSGARARVVRPASKLVPGDFQQHNHHKIITTSLRILIETLPKPPATFPDISGSATEPPGVAQSFLDSPPEDPPAPGRSRARRPAGLKTGPRRVLAAQSSLNHHKISSNPKRNPSKTSYNLPRSLEAPQSFLEPRKNVSGPDSGLWTPDYRTGRPQNWSPAISSSTIITKSSQDLFESS